MQSYILTYYRLRKREPLVALSSHRGGGGRGGGVISASAVPHRGDKGQTYIGKSDGVVSAPLGPQCKCCDAYRAACRSINDPSGCYPQDELASCPLLGHTPRHQSGQQSNAASVPWFVKSMSHEKPKAQKQSKKQDAFDASRVTWSESFWLLASLLCFWLLLLKLISHEKQKACF